MLMKNFKSLYGENPPELVIEPIEGDDMIEEPVIESLSDIDFSFDELERKEFSELIKWEKKT